MPCYAGVQLKHKNMTAFTHFSMSTFLLSFCIHPPTYKLVVTMNRFTRGGSSGKRAGLLQRRVTPGPDEEDYMDIPSKRSIDHFPADIPSNIPPAVKMKPKTLNHARMELGVVEYDFSKGLQERRYWCNVW